VLELHGGSARSPILGRDGDSDGCYANDDQLQVVTHMTHRSEYFAGKTESSVAVNAADTTAGGWAIAYEQMALVGADGGRSTRSILDRVAHALALVQPGSLVEQSITISRS